MIETLTMALVGSAAILNSFMDRSSEGIFTSKYWNKDQGASYKWKLDKKGRLIKIKKAPWFYLGITKPKYKERFPFSSTALVLLTDGWHLLQFLFHSCWQLAIAIQMDKPILMFILIKTLFSLIFELVYKPLDK